MFDSKTIMYLKQFKKLALAVSGGRDSMAMLYSFMKIRNDVDFFVLTVHHNLRGDEGKRDRDFVKDFCEKNNIECLVFEEDIKGFCDKNGYTIEQGARIRRRTIFSDIVSSFKADRVVTAHHKQDQIESILMHIFRGCGLKGLCGMSLDTGTIIRPMLAISRQDIDSYIENNNIKYVQDSTNNELVYSRNNVRNVILKDIEKCYPNVGDNILRLSNIANGIQSYIYEKTPKAVVENCHAYINIDDIKSKDIIATQCIINAVEQISTRVDFENEHIQMVFDLIDKENGKKIDLPFEVEAYKEYDRIVFLKKAKKDVVSEDFFIGSKVMGNYLVEASFEDNGGLRMDYDLVKNCSYRTRQNGDKFKRFKGGTKNLGDYFTDIKVPARIRDDVLLLAIDHEIFVVLSYEISDNVAITDKTKKTIYIKTQKIKG